MRRFVLQRDQDATGISGTGAVAEGVQFSSGWVALTWRTAVTSVAFYPDIESVRHIHGHNGLTRVAWIDPPTEGGA